MYESKIKIREYIRNRCIGESVYKIVTVTDNMIEIEQALKDLFRSVYSDAVTLSIVAIKTIKMQERQQKLWE